jgi:PhnB protein
MAVKPRPDGYHSVTPYLIVHDGNAAIEYYKKAFGATELMRMPGPGGKVMHAEIKIGDSPVMLADEFPDMGWKSPKSYGGTPVTLMIYVDDVDKTFDQALKAGGNILKPLRNEFYGDRTGTFADPFGHCWTISTHVEDVPPEEMGRRMKEMMAKQGG